MAEPQIAAPFVSSVMRIEPQWIDYNGHLNVAYYNVLFDRAVDEIYELVGLGPAYLERTRHSTMVVEAHVRYLRELHENDPVRVSAQLLDYDAKRIHLYEELHHATEGWLSATSENMTLSVDMTSKKVAPFHDSVLRTLGRMKVAHARLPRPDAAGRSVKMPDKSAPKRG
ncbi:MAG: thioesterase family protein [Pseudolabrys sp.]